MKHATKKRPVHHDSYLEGAADCNHNWMRKLRRMQKTATNPTAVMLLNDLVSFGVNRITRNKARKGGM